VSTSRAIALAPSPSGRRVHPRGGAPAAPAVATASAARGVLRQVAVIAGAAVAYLAVRALTQGDVGAAEANARHVLDVERSLGLDWEGGAQDVLLDHPSIIRALNAVYVWAFWPFVAGALVTLYRRDRRGYRVLRDAVFASGAFGLVVFALFPCAPPRFLDGFTDTIASLSGQDGLAHPSGFTNEYAAMPSFHVGWTVLAGVCLLPVLRHRWSRVLALTHGGLMAVTVVGTANHYVLDVVAGIALALGGLALVRAVHRARAADRPDLSGGPARRQARPPRSTHDHNRTIPTSRPAPLDDTRHPTPARPGGAVPVRSRRRAVVRT
jgi:hypothetical protein